MHFKVLVKGVFFLDATKKPQNKIKILAHNNWTPIISLSLSFFFFFPLFSFFNFVM